MTDLRQPQPMTHVTLDADVGKTPRREDKGMPNGNAEVIRNLYQAVARGDIPAVRELLDPQVEWQAPASLPWGGTFHGHEGFQEFLGKVTEHLEEFRLEPRQLLDVGERVVVLLRLVGRPKGRDSQFDVPEVHVWTVHRGRIVGLEAYFDTAIVLGALGLETTA